MRSINNTPYREVFACHVILPHWLQSRGVFNKTATNRFEFPPPPLACLLVLFCMPTPLLGRIDSIVLLKILIFGLNKQAMG